MLPECRFCLGREVLCPHLRKSPGCHTVGLEAVRRHVCITGQSKEPVRNFLLLWGKLRSQESLYQNGGPPTPTLFMIISLPINYTCAVFQLTTVEGGEVYSMLPI